MNSSSLGPDSCPAVPSPALTLAESCDVKVATFSWDDSSALRSFRICCEGDGDALTVAEEV